MDDLRAGARELAEQSLEKAYADVLENYLTYSASGGDVQKVFATQIYGRAAGSSLQKTTQIRQLVHRILWTLPAMWRTRVSGL